MSAKHKIATHARDAFAQALEAAFDKKFDIVVTCMWNFMIDRRVTARDDNRRITKEQREFIAGFEAGYLACIAAVEEV